jgi:hypothetical protein
MSNVIPSCWMNVAGYHTSFWRLMWIAFNVGIKESGHPSYFSWSPTHAICSNLALSKMSGCFGTEGSIGGRDAPQSRRVLRVRVTRT